MKDLEKIRKKFEEDIFLAEKENRICEDLTVADISIIGRKFRDNSRFQVSVRPLKGFSYEAAIGEILKKFPPTDNIPEDENTNLNIELYRYAHVANTTVYVMWYHDDLYFYTSYEMVDVPEGLFKKVSRTIPRNETPHGMPEMKDKEITYLCPNCPVINYVGGRKRSNNEEWNNDFVEYLIKRYETEI